MKTHNPSQESPSSPATLGSPHLQSRFADDPWSLSLEERAQLARELAASQDLWLPRVRRLVEPPQPGDDFPAFAMELAPFSHLGREVADAASIAELPTGVADELQRFADQFRTWATSPDPDWQPHPGPEMIEP